MRLDSPLVLATAGTLAIHVILAVCAEAIVVTHPVQPEEVPPHVELVDIISTPPPPPPPKAPEPEVRQPEAPRPDPAPPPPRAARVRAAAARATETPPEAARPPENPPAAAPGGAPTLAMPDLAPGATGIPVARGPRTERVGRGGTGTGAGAGSGAGSAETAAPASIATIKTRAMPRGDYDYFDAGKDYPEEAKQLGLEGQIRVRLVVDAQGHVGSAVLLNRLGHGLDELALRRAKAIQFAPARDTDDHPVSSVVVWTFTMTLPK